MKIKPKVKYKKIKKYLKEKSQQKKIIIAYNKSKRIPYF